MVRILIGISIPRGSPALEQSNQGAREALLSLTAGSDRVPRIQWGKCVGAPIVESRKENRLDQSAMCFIFPGINLLRRSNGMTYSPRMTYSTHISVLKHHRSDAYMKRTGGVTNRNCWLELPRLAGYNSRPDVVGVFSCKSNLSNHANHVKALFTSPP